MRLTQAEKAELSWRSGLYLTAAACDRLAAAEAGREPWSWASLPGWRGGHGLVHLRFTSGMRCTVHVDAPASGLLGRWLTSERRR